MSRSTRFILALGFPVILILLSCSRSGQPARELEVFLDNFRELHIPDTRTSLWTLQVETGNGLAVEGFMADRELYERLQREVGEVFPQVDFAVTCLPETGNAGEVNGLANNSVIHLRREPSSRSEMVTQVLLGSPVSILLERDGKSLIQVADGYLGWVNSPEVCRIEKGELEELRNSRKVVYRAQYGFSYEEPAPEAFPVSDLVMGSMLVVEDEAKSHIKVRYPDGRKAWVRREECVDAMELFSMEPEGKDIVGTALRYHGIPYLWGGTSAKNLDCSGLVSNVYFMNGILMPRDADMQSRCGRIVASEFGAAGLQEGDLLFFGRKATEDRDERVSHVAIYMGDQQFIHASGYRERVSIHSMDSLQASYIPEYPEIFIRAVRILGEEEGAALTVLENAFYRQISGQAE